MKNTASFIRIIGFMVIAFLLLEFVIDSGEQLAIVTYPIIWAVLTALLVFAIAIEIIVAALDRVLQKGLPEEAQERYYEINENQFAGLKKLYLRMLGTKPMESEGEIILDHDYDGIRELDNDLPPWWRYMFYASIIFAVVYLLRYHVFEGTNQIEEYEMELAQAQEEIEAYKKTAKDLVDADSVEMLTDAGDLSAGKTIFETNCVACHKSDGGGGIGPNLTDPNWILGGGIKNVFHTISEGGRDGKGMVAWKSELKPLEIAQVSSYVLTLGGTTPAEPKAAEGDVWVDEAATE